jgi:hypothetical protein
VRSCIIHFEGNIRGQCGGKIVTFHSIFGTYLDIQLGSEREIVRNQSDEKKQGLK